MPKHEVQNRGAASRDSSLAGHGPHACKNIWDKTITAMQGSGFSLAVEQIKQILTPWQNQLHTL
jgi:hypothetical protein